MVELPAEVDGLIFDKRTREWVSTKPGRVVLTAGVVVDIIEVGADGWNTGVIVLDLVVGSSEDYPQGQTCMFHNDEVQ